MQASLEPLGELTGFGTSAAGFAAEGDQPVLDKSNIVQQPRIDAYDITINGNKLIYAHLNGQCLVLWNVLCKFPTLTKPIQEGTRIRHLAHEAL